ncbi:MAG TPA: hypothetical protein VGF48_24850 [Thermoanaerobaculia bacterium]|jgi:hypothetical protein
MRLRAFLLGGSIVAILDGLDAVLFFGARGVAPHRIAQAIASGVLGRDAFRGGTGTIALGIALHFLIAFAIVAIYHLAATRFAILRERPVLCGMVYGLLAYVVMNEIVLPLSAAATGPRPWPVLLNGLLIHALGVGLPAALTVFRGVDVPPAAAWRPAAE